ncbi:sensor histidine kinase [Halarchaeum sp. P4]|uniref:sensor histidine kinase n=1 Tax=Halarchaeum sp. P4 TaxID=3421639 RepID=UPI003EC10C0E
MSADALPADGTVLPLVADAANRRVLSEWLEAEGYGVTTGDPGDVDFDLCVLDPDALFDHRAVLAERKAAARAVLPYVLLVPDAQREATEALRRDHPDLWRLVDGVVSVPIRQYEFGGRVESLLRLRAQSQTIAARERELEILNRVLRHDIRNDMMVVLGWLGMLRDDASDEQLPTLDRIEAAADHVVELTLIAADIARTMTGDEAVPLRPMSLTTVLREEVEKCQVAFSAAHIEFVADPPEVTVVANDLLGSVFRNLLNNAVQHNTADRPEVTVRVEEREDTVCVIVSDNGPGIPDAIRDRLFVTEVKGLESSGAGMGLYLVGALTTTYGGDVWVEDDETRGATFVVELPLAERDADA